MALTWLTMLSISRSMGTTMRRNNNRLPLIRAIYTKASHPRRSFYMHEKPHTPYAAAASAVSAVIISGCFYGSTVFARSSTENAVISEADALYTAGTYDDKVKLYRLLLAASEQYPTSSEILWRLARASYDISEYETDKDAKKKYLYEANTNAIRSVNLDPENFACHKWAAISISQIGEYESVKVKISNAFTIRDHFIRACELNPADPTSEHLLGVWCFTMAEMNWITRNLAATVFATPPSSNYEEALSHFKRAEMIDPGFYKANTLYLARTYYALGEKEKARECLHKCISMRIKNPDDKKSHDEAVKLKY